MDIEVKRMSGGVAVLYLNGNLNTTQLSQFKHEIQNLVEQSHSTIVVDCRELGQISSSGLAALLWARATVKADGGKIYLSEVSALVADVLRITKLSTLLSIESSTKVLLERLGRIRKHASGGKRSANKASLAYKNFNV